MTERFSHLHVHSEFSKLDGCATVKEYVQAAAERGHPGLACTEHGSLRGFFDLMKATTGTEVKPVFGIEFYVCSDMKRRGLSDEEKVVAAMGKKGKEKNEAVRAEEKRRGLRGAWHLTAWALDNEGLKNLFRLSTKSWSEGFYYKPRVDLDAIAAHSKGVAIGSACVSGILSELRREGKAKEADEVAERLVDIFGDRFWLEIMPHDLDEQRFANNVAIEYHKRFDRKVRLLATQDAHYLTQEDAEHQGVLLAIGTNSTIFDPDRFAFQGDHYWFKTRAEMEASFREFHPGIPDELVLAALDNTVELVAGVSTSVKADPLAALLPAVEVPGDFKSPFDFLQGLCLDGWERLGIVDRAEWVGKRFGWDGEAASAVYRKRLVHELKVIAKLNFAPYFLVVRDVYEWAKSKSIECGPGRGSSAGSLVAFLLGITSIDPVQHNLMFERFINPGRVNLPDIDCDFEDARRDEIFDYLRAKHGAGNCARIATIGRMAAKQVVKDVGRVLDISFTEMNRLTANLSDDMTIEECFEKIEVCRQFHKEHPAVLYHAKRLEGMAKNLGVHAAGFVASPVPLTEILPLETRDHKGGKPVVVTAIDMEGVEGLGLLKLDILGLRTMTVIRKTREAVRERHGIELDLAGLDLEDQAVLEKFSAGDFIGVFQFDTHTMSRLAAGMKFDRFEDIAILNALNRPGTSRSGLAQEYLNRKRDPEKVKETSFHPKIDAITTDTLGVIVYQEHVIRILVDLAGFDLVEADKVRKLVGKSKGVEAVEEIRGKFLAGVQMTTPDMDAELASKLMDKLVEFGAYAFNKSHAVAYGVVAFWCQWLKIHFPTEFFWALMDCEPDQTKIQRIARIIIKRGHKVLPPDVSKSKTGFMIDGDAIRGSIQDIKGIGDVAAAAVINGQPFAGLIDFLQRTPRRQVNRRTVASLAMAGALGDMVPNPKWFVENIESVWKLVAKSNWEAVGAAVKASELEPGWDDEARIRASASVNPMAFGAHPLDTWGPFIESNVKVEGLVDLSDPEHYQVHDDDLVFIIGVLAEVQFGHFEAKTEAEGERFGWTREFCSLFLEDESGRRHKVPVGWNLIDDFRSIVTESAGTLILAAVRVSKEWESNWAAFLVSIPELSRKVKVGENLNVWERIAIGRHPAVEFPWKLKESKRAAFEDMRRRTRKAGFGSIFKVTGVIANVKPKLTKNDEEMCHFWIVGVKGWAEVTCFVKEWTQVQKSIRPGRLVTVRLEKDRKYSNILGDQGKVWIHKKETEV